MKKMIEQTHRLDKDENIQDVIAGLRALPYCRFVYAQHSRADLTQPDTLVAMFDIADKNMPLAPGQRYVEVPETLLPPSEHVMHSVELPVYGITIEGEGIRSRLKEEVAGQPTDPEFNAAMDAIESLILAQHQAGIDVTSPAYLEALETAVDAIANHFDQAAAVDGAKAREREASSAGIQREKDTVDLMLEARAMGFEVYPDPEQPHLYYFSDPSGESSGISFDSEAAAWSQVIEELPTYRSMFDSDIEATSAAAPEPPPELSRASTDEIIAYFKASLAQRDGGVWVDRAMHLVNAAIPAAVYRRDKAGFHLTPESLKRSIDIDTMIDIARDANFPNKIREGVARYIEMLPKTDENTIREALLDNSTRDAHGFIAMPIKFILDQMAPGNTISIAEMLEARDMGFEVHPDTDQPGRFYFSDPSGEGSDISFDSEADAWRQVISELPTYRSMFDDPDISMEP